jgi:FtsP/CotA-like multicopper oxidase with cupredoxin domain
MERGKRILITAGLVLLLCSPGALAAPYCPNDDIDMFPFGWAQGGARGPEDYDKNGNGTFDGDPDIHCMHLAAGDGFANMGDGKLQYIFGFSQVPFGLAEGDITAERTLKQEISAPTIVVKEGQELYLSLTNVGMNKRPDLFDPHSVHWHGFANAAPVFDGLPESGPTINMFATYVYYYKPAEAGTFFYHCHVEATEHMQMGMMGNLYVLPAQDGTSFEYPAGSGRTYTKFAYNDGDGSTGYDIGYALQITAFDSNFHDQHIAVQPLPFADMDDDYHMLNGRGYPDTINPNPILNSYNGNPSQKINSLIEAAAGQKILLRLSGVQTVHHISFAVLGIPMKVVGRGARLLRSADGKNISYDTNVINIGGGEGFDIILDTAGIPPGTYFLYATNPEALVNGPEERGGLMTEIVIN